MAERFEHAEDDELTEILRRAVHKEASSSADLSQRLLAAADELGISHQAVAEAEAEYRQESARNRELVLYNKDRRKAFNVHLVTYGLVNFFFLALNLMTWHEDHEIWFPYVLLLWGIGLGIHAFVTHRMADWDDEEFQKWRAERAIKRGEYP